MGQSWTRFDTLGMQAGIHTFRSQNMQVRQYSPTSDAPVCPSPPLASCLEAIIIILMKWKLNKYSIGNNPEFRQFASFSAINCLNEPHRDMRIMERAKGVEPSSLAWEARVMPLYDARNISKKLKCSSPSFAGSRPCQARYLGLAVQRLGTCASKPRFTPRH